MAVSVFPHYRVRARRRLATLPPVILVLTLIAPGLDLLAIGQTGVAVPGVGVLSTALSSGALLVIWARFARTSWLAAAGLASLASLAMRLMGAEVAPVLSLLAIVALGAGGAFAAAGGSAGQLTDTSASIDSTDLLGGRAA